MELKLLLMFPLLWSIETSVGSAEALSRDVNISLQVKPELHVDVPLGGDTELHCQNETSEGLVRWWQTPFGSFRDQKLSNSDPIHIANGDVKIRRASASHAGLYQCHLLDNRGTETTIIPYRVSIVNNSLKMKISLNKPIENADFSDPHLAAAVSSSVLVTFIAAFTLGAFCQPHVIRCLKRARERMCTKTVPQESIPDEGETFHNPSQLKVLFRRNIDSEDTVDFSSESIETPANATSNPDQDGFTGVESETKSNREAGDESEKQMDEEGQEQDPETTHMQPKRVSRVIKLYNYDEEGNPYSHIKDSQTEPTPRQRVMSLTRLQSIMNQAEFSTSTDSTEPEKTPSLT